MQETKHPNGLLWSIAKRWKEDPALCGLIRFNRVYTGRVPGTELTRFPYCSILTSPGWSVRRSDKSDVSKQRVTFSLWLDDATLHLGELIEDELYRVYANQSWIVERESANIPCRGRMPKMQVLDCLDRGEGGPKQTTIATVKAWEVQRTFVLVIQRQRQDQGACPAVATSSSSTLPGSQSQPSSASLPSASSSRTSGEEEEVELAVA